MAKFKLVYNKTNKDGKLNGSYVGIPSAEDKEITVSNLEGAKLVYLDESTEKKVIKASKTGIPAKEDLVVCTLEALEETGDVVEVKTESEPIVETTKDAATTKTNTKSVKQPAKK